MRAFFVCVAWVLACKDVQTEFALRGTAEKEASRLRGELRASSNMVDRLKSKNTINSWSAEQLAELVHEQEEALRVSTSALVDARRRLGQMPDGRMMEEVDP